MDEITWRGRRVAWQRTGRGPAVVLCHGTPWSSYVWHDLAARLAADHTVYTYDMPGYGSSSKQPEHPVGLDVQGELLAELLDRWGLQRPAVVAHDIGGAVALRTHLLHGVDYVSLLLIDAVVMAPWGSPFFTLVREHADVFARLPDRLHRALVREYIAGASTSDLPEPVLDALVAPWLGEEGRPAFYAQIAQASPDHTEEVVARLHDVRCPSGVVWGEDDAWLPPERGRRLAAALPGAALTEIAGAGHLVQLDAPDELAAIVTGWQHANAGL